MFTHVLLASDGSECAIKATEAAGTLARRFDARLTVLHVFTLPASAVLPFATGEPVVAVDPTLIDEWATAARNTVERRTASALEAGDVPFTLRQEIGHPAETIIAVADAEKCDLIVR